MNLQVCKNKIKIVKILHALCMLRGLMKSSHGPEYSKTSTAHIVPSNCYDPVTKQLTLVVLKVLIKEARVTMSEVRVLIKLRNNTFGRPLVLVIKCSAVLSDKVLVNKLQATIVPAPD